MIQLNTDTWQQQMNAYIQYLATNLKLKYSANIHYVGERYYNYPGPGFGEPCKVFNSIHFRYLWKGIKILTFAEFLESSFYKHQKV